MGQLTQIGECYILHDEDALGNLTLKHFDLDYWHSQADSETVFGGRGGSLKVNLNGIPAILRQYRRGGMVARLSDDRYLWLGKKQSRAWREWAILNRAIEAGLPVPKPLGACICRKGISYRAAIITAYIEQSETLAERISHSALDTKNWHRLGLVLKQFQEQLFRHADLNANNILIDKQDRFYLIDFDKARCMKNLDDWQWTSLRRLQRSLEKIDRQQKLHYRPGDWQALIDGYQST